MRERSRQRGTPTQQGYGPDWRRIRADAIAAQPWCSRCGTLLDLTGDHIVPLSRGGPTVLDNVQVLCRRCNAAKRDRSGRAGEISTAVRPE